MKTTSKLILTTLLIVIFFSCSENTEHITESFNLKLNDSPNSVKQIEIEIVEQINAYRISKNLSSLKTDSSIKKIASSHTQYMIEKGRMSHDHFQQRKNHLIKHENATHIGENVAYGYESAEKLVKAWIKSDSHRRTMEGNFNHFDISAKKSEKGVWFFTNIFVKKKNY